MGEIYFLALNLVCIFVFSLWDALDPVFCSYESSLDET